MSNWFVWKFPQVFPGIREDQRIEELLVKIRAFCFCGTDIPEAIHNPGLVSSCNGKTGSPRFRNELTDHADDSKAYLESDGSTSTSCSSVNLDHKMAI